MDKKKLSDDSLVDCGRNSGIDGKNPIADLSSGYVCDLEDKKTRQKQLQFHIEHGDYFATLATVCHIAAKEKRINLRKIFEKLAEDLQYVQENYEICKKRK